MLVLLCSMSLAQARPVDVEKAKAVGQKFVCANFNNESKSNELQLVYTGLSNRDEACFYVFNVGQEGFVIVSADDRFRPIVGYSDEGVFATENPSPEVMFYLDKIVEARTSPDVVLFDYTADEWQSVMTTGRLISQNRGRGVDYICTTKWNQDSPYNLYAPAASSGPGGRCYAGCVATAMSQVMKRWDHPLQGTGSHSYYCWGYGSQSANFGNTTYDWDNMPDRLGGNSSQQEIEAVALLMYHCAVAVNMGFSPSGSGANSEDVPGAIRQYFSYSNNATLRSRSSYGLTAWQNLLKESFDLGWPVYYSGHSDDGGHAFVCDGYTDDNLFHFNWGWGGSSDGWFVVDEIDFSSWAQAIFNFVPSDVYTYMPQEPTNLSVVSHGDFEYSATVSWTNPSRNIHNNNLSSIDKIVVTRDGKIIHTITNATPGASMSYVDHYMPTVVRYGVYAVVHNAQGKEAYEEGVILGPSCVLRLDMTSDDSQGWNNGYLSFVNDAGIEIAQVTAYAANYSSNVELPLGRVGVYWNRPTTAIDKIGFVLTDGSGNTVISYEGGSNDLNKGLFFIVNNSCGDETNHNAPSHFTATRNGAFVQLAWSAPVGQVNHYYVYRDNVLFAVAQGTSYTDNNAADGFHSYYVTAFNEKGESDASNVDNVSNAVACDAPSNLRYEMTTPSKVKLMWDAPQGSVTGYMVYRRAKGEEFKRIKLLTNTYYTDNLTSQPDNRFEYAVKAYYQENDCESGYASAQDNPARYFVEVNKSIIPQHLVAEVDGSNVVLHWHEATMASSYNVYRNGERIAEGLTEPQYTDNTATAQDIQTYVVTGETDFIESSPTNEVTADWTSLSEENIADQNVVIYPNPTKGVLVVETQSSSQIECRVYNPMGQEVMRQVGDAGQMTLNLTSLPDGTYFIKVVTPAENMTVKVVKIQ